MKIPDHTVQTAYASPLGAMTLAATYRALVGAWFTDDPLLQRAAVQLDEYFAGRRNRFDLPLNLGTGTPFQNAVWQALLGIEFGATCTYGFVSAQIGRLKAMRAVGAAIGRNPLSIIVPCHRVIGASGGLTGYAGGLHRKTALLQLEGVL